MNSTLSLMVVVVVCLVVVILILLRMISDLQDRLDKSLARGLHGIVDATKNLADATSSVSQSVGQAVAAAMTPAPVILTPHDDGQRDDPFGNYNAGTSADDTDPSDAFIPADRVDAVGVNLRDDPTLGIPGFMVDIVTDDPTMTL